MKVNKESGKDKNSTIVFFFFNKRVRLSGGCGGRGGAHAYTHKINFFFSDRTLLISIFFFKL